MNQSILLILLLGTVVCVSSVLLGEDGEGNDYTFGARLTTSTLIAQEVISKRKLLLQTTTRTYTLTQAGTAKNIDYIRITDLKRKRGASAEITSGGVGSTTVTIRFTSARGSAIKSQVEIWGT